MRALCLEPEPERRVSGWNERRKCTGYRKISAALTPPEKEEHFDEVSSVPVQLRLRYLRYCVSSIFSPGGHSTRVSDAKMAPESVEYTANTFRRNGTALRPEKTEKPLAIRWLRTTPEAQSERQVTMSKVTTADAASMLYGDVDSARPVAAGRIGVNLELTHFAILPTGEKIAARMRCEGARRSLQGYRGLAFAKKQEGPANFRETNLMVARMHTVTADYRMKFPHKLSTRLVNGNPLTTTESVSVRDILNKPLPVGIDHRFGPVRIHAATGVQDAMVWAHAERYRPLASIRQAMR